MADLTFDPCAVEDENLMTPDQMRDQEKWDEEFKRRQYDLERQQLQSRERRRQVSAKMSYLRARWEGIEQRRVLRSRQGSGSGEMMTSPMLMTTAQTPETASLSRQPIESQPEGSLSANQLAVSGRHQDQTGR